MDYTSLDLSPKTPSLHDKNKPYQITIDISKNFQTNKINKEKQQQSSAAGFIRDSVHTNKINDKKLKEHQKLYSSSRIKSNDCSYKKDLNFPKPSTNTNFSKNTEEEKRKLNTPNLYNLREQSWENFFMSSTDSKKTSSTSSGCHDNRNSSKDFSTNSKIREKFEGNGSGTSSYSSGLHNKTNDSKKLKEHNHKMINNKVISDESSTVVLNEDTIAGNSRLYNLQQNQKTDVIMPANVQFNIDELSRRHNITNLYNLREQSWDNFFMAKDLVKSDDFSPILPSKSFINNTTNRSTSKRKYNVMCLDKADMGLYGLCPENENFLVVVCNYCDAVIKPQGLKKHLKNHNTNSNCNNNNNINRNSNTNANVNNNSNTSNSSSNSSIKHSLIHHSSEERLIHKNDDTSKYFNNSSAIAAGNSNSSSKLSKNKSNFKLDYDPNIHCGVLTADSMKPCTRSLTCKLHGISLRRSVNGRSKPFDKLLAEYRAEKESYPDKSNNSSSSHNKNESDKVSVAFHDANKDNNKITESNVPKINETDIITDCIEPLPNELSNASASIEINDQQNVQLQTSIPPVLPQNLSKIKLIKSVCSEENNPNPINEKLETDRQVEPKTNGGNVDGGIGNSNENTDQEMQLATNPNYPLLCPNIREDISITEISETEIENNLQQQNDAENENYSSESLQQQLLHNLDIVPSANHSAELKEEPLSPSDQRNYSEIINQQKLTLLNAITATQMEEEFEPEPIIKQEVPSLFLDSSFDSDSELSLIDFSGNSLRNIRKDNLEMYLDESRVQNWYTQKPKPIHLKKFKRMGSLRGCVIFGKASSRLNPIFHQDQCDTTKQNSCDTKFPEMAVLPPDPVYVLRCPDLEPVNSICFHQNERILSGTAKGSIHLFDLQTNRAFLHFNIGTEPVTSLHHSEEVLFTQEKGGRIRSWAMTNTGYIEKFSFDAHHAAFCRSEFISEEELLIFPKEENLICMRSTNQESPDISCIEFKLDEDLKLGHVSCLRSISRNQNYYLMAGYESGDVLTWDLRSTKILNKETLQEFPCALDYDPNTNRGICGGSEDKLSVFSYDRQAMNLQKKSEIGIKNAGVNCVKIRQDQKVFVTAGWDGRIRIFSWKSLRPLAVLTEHKNGGVMDLVFSTGKVSMWKANIMAAGGVDGQISLWDLYN